MRTFEKKEMVLKVEFGILARKTQEISPLS